MKLIDRFDCSTDNWRRGKAVPSRKPGPLAIDSNPRSNHVTLSGMSVHPENFHQFKACIIWAFINREDDEARFIVALGKSHEWSPVGEASIFIHIDRFSTARIIARDGRLMGEVKIREREDRKFSLRFAVAEHKLVICGAEFDVEVNLPGNLNMAGYLTVKAKKTPVTLHDFELETEEDHPPLDEAGRKADIDAWLRSKMEKNHLDIDKLEAYLKDNPDPFKTGFANIALNPGLVCACEKVTINFSYHGDSKNISNPVLEYNYLGAAHGESQLLELEWQSNKDGLWTAGIEVAAIKPGNCRVVWTVDGQRLSRIFGVIETGYAVCTLWIGSNIPDIDSGIHRYDLPGDYWVGDWWSPFDKPTEDILNYISRYAKMRHRFGDRLAPFINATWLISDIPDFNLMDLDKDMQAEGLALAKRLWSLLGIGPLEILASYTFSHETPKIAEKLGIKAINSLCIWQNWLDGSDENCWKINHWGAPNAPYYVAEDDFRKAGGKPGIVSLSMGTASSVRNYSIYTLEGCPTLTNPSQRYTGQTAQSTNMVRFYDAVDGWLHDSDYQSEPVFFTVGLENFIDSPDWVKANDMSVEYLVKKAKTEKLVFASAADIADYFKAHYSEQPENIYYQPDIYCGYRCQGKPARIPDRIETSNMNFHTLHVKHRTLPQFFWDYDSLWKEPEWSEQMELRNEYGLIAPEKVNVGNCVPAQVDLTGIEVLIEKIDLEDGLLVKVMVGSAKPIKRLPLAVWDIPLYSNDSGVVDMSGNIRFIKVVDGFTGNLNGLVVCNDVKEGNTEFFLRLKGRKRRSVSVDFTIVPHFCGRAVNMPNGIHTYLWLADGVSAGELILMLPVDTKAVVHYNDGRTAVPGPTGKLVIAFDGTWQRETPVLTGIDIFEYCRGSMKYIT